MFHSGLLVVSVLLAFFRCVTEANSRVRIHHLTGGLTNGVVASAVGSPDVAFAGETGTTTCTWFLGVANAWHLPLHTDVLVNLCSGSVVVS